MKNKKKHPLYNTWCEMKKRCYNPNAINYKNYGGRGITVCDEWKDNFEMFVYHMGPKPSPEHTLDRIDNDYIYCPENCKWSTKKEQQANRRQQSRPKNAKGYTYNKQAGKYQAQISVNGTMKFLGLYDCPLMARLAYTDALKELTNHA